MVPMIRRPSVVALLILSTSLGITGCMSTGANLASLNPASTYAPPQLPRDPALTTGSAGLLPALTQAADPSRSATAASYNPQAKFTGQASPAPGMPEGVALEPGLGMPSVVSAVVQYAPPLPTEKARTTHSPHRVAAPDILFIESLRLVPKGPYRLEPMEVLQIEIVGVFKDQIKGLYMISPEGTINLGNTLRPIPVSGMTVDRAQAAITEYLRTVVNKEFNVSVALVQMRAMQNVRGEHLVRPDGTIHMGMYGSVYVAGMTLGQVKCTIENHLSAYLVNPQISVDVFAYNSRKIYIIADGAGYGQQVVALPSTGNETVLDAISRVQGLPQVSSLKKIWVARPSPAGHPCSQILPVDWKAITQFGRTETNYQLLEGDRIYISADPLITVYNYIDKMVAPIERLLGVTLLGNSTYQSLRTGGISSGLLVLP